MRLNICSIGVCTAIAIITFLFLLSPWLIPINSVEALEGAAWTIDFEAKWHELPPIPRTMYTIGDIICHQKQERSYTINRNQMPICARDIGLLFGLTIGFGLSITIDKRPQLLSTASQILRVQGVYRVTALIILLVGPLIIDGLFQSLTDYESINILRTTTGLLFGVGLAAGVSSVVLTDPRLKF